MTLYSAYARRLLYANSLGAAAGTKKRERARARLLHTDIMRLHAATPKRTTRGGERVEGTQHEGAAARTRR